jgi:dihydrofolate reductase
MISLIVAASTNNVIGAKGELPWRLSGDLKRFKAQTMGKPIVMGRLTYESIGRALPGRQNIVITRQADFEAEGCDVVQSVDAAIEAAGDAEEIMVIGGSHIYQAFLPVADRIYLTRVQADIDGDTFLPDINAGSMRANGVRRRGSSMRLMIRTISLWSSQHWSGEWYVWLLRHSCYKIGRQFGEKCFLGEGNDEICTCSDFLYFFCFGRHQSGRRPRG